MVVGSGTRMGVMHIKTGRWLPGSRRTDSGVREDKVRHMPKESAEGAAHELRRPSIFSLKRRVDAPAQALAGPIADAPSTWAISTRDRVFRRSLIYADVIAMA